MLFGTKKGTTLIGPQKVLCSQVLALLLAKVVVGSVQHLRQGGCSPILQPQFLVERPLVVHRLEEGFLSEAGPLDDTVVQKGLVVRLIPPKRLYFSLLLTA